MSRIFVAFLLAFAAVSAVEARPLTPAEERYAPWAGEIPACDTLEVLERIKSRFHQSESEFWGSGLDLVSFDRFRELGFRPDGPDYIPRRYCTARGVLNDGKIRQVTYMIAEDLGFAGGDFFGLLPLTGRSNVMSNWGVTFCVDGLDRHYAYGKGCMALRP